MQRYITVHMYLYKCAYAGSSSCARPSYFLTFDSHAYFWTKAPNECLRTGDKQMSGAIRLEKLISYYIQNTAHAANFMRPTNLSGERAKARYSHSWCNDSIDDV